MPRVAAAHLGVLIGLPIAACFVKPAAPDGVIRDSGIVQTDMDVTMTDAMGDGPPPPACVLEDFVGAGSNCGPWATVINGGASWQNGALSLYVTSVPNPARATCETSSPAAILQATLDIVSVPMTMTESTSFYVAKSGSRYGATLSTGTGATFLAVDCNGSIPANTEWLPASMHRVRLSVVLPTLLEVQTSDSAAGPWATLGSCTAPFALDGVTVGVELLRSTGSNESIPSFASVEVCQ